MIKTNNFTQNENIDLMNEISLIHPMDTPLTTLILGAGQYDKATSKIVTWRERELNADTDMTVEEGSETTEFQNSVRKEMNNVCSIFKRAVSVSGSAMASDVVGIKDMLGEELNDRLIEMKINMEKAFLNSVKDDGSTSGIRKLQGLQNFTTTKNKITDVFSEDTFKATVRKLWDAGLGTGEYVALVNADLKEKIDALYKDKYYYQAQNDKFGIVANTIQTNYGNVHLILDRHMDADKILIFDPSFVRIAFLRTPQFEMLAKTGDSVKAQVIAEPTIKLLNAKAVAMFTEKVGA
ncbi:DUF5309 domain-containing protein [Sporanaerobacter acetigenes]|uniref:Phage major capsid protein, HK97 family n=1 Tax=Sporanaerobacter acetigenes DSM 13106 TaxID=1123281 RepID=A0A1M5RZL1_9FIRM|nr:DUF5309 domain-containing protein [Sporanaerobacter acetigenes]SHH31639.1 hypothetical protein SAMN02745180_00027 [Sporanaerobacter acetigenes DSM 13106]